MSKKPRMGLFGCNIDAYIASITVMNNTTWVYIAVAGGWYLMSSPKTTVMPVPVVVTGGTTTPTGTGTGALKTIVGRAGSYTCTVATLSDAGRTNGSVYVMQGKSRADFRTDDAASGKTIESHVIRTNGLVYSWVDGDLTSGSKEADTGTSLIPKNTKAGGFIGTDDANVSWDCHAWIPNLNQFAIPTNVTFTN